MLDKPAILPDDPEELRSFTACLLAEVKAQAIVIELAVSARSLPYAAMLDGWLKRQGMRSSMALFGWPSRIARRVSAM